MGPAYVRTELNTDWLSQAGNLEWVVEGMRAGRLGRSEGVAGQHILLYGGWTAR